MASNNKKKKVEPKPEPVVEIQEVAEIETPTPEVIVEETPVAVEVPTKVVNVKIYRDGEGRLVLDQEGKSKRIAGSDDAFIEVARQFGEKLVKERQI